MNTNQHLVAIATARWQQILAMPVQSNHAVLLDIVFITDCGIYRIYGSDYLTSSGDDEFGLFTEIFHPDGWWSKDDANAWTPLDITEKLRTHGNTDLLDCPRTCVATLSADRIDNSHIYDNISIYRHGHSPQIGIDISLSSTHLGCILLGEV